MLSDTQLALGLASRLSADSARCVDGGTPSGIVPTDYVIFFVTALFVVIGAGLFRVDLMHFKSEPPEDARKGWLFIALGIVFGIAAVLILILKAAKMGD